LIGWCLSTLLAVALPGQHFLHYFQLWLPVLAVLGGLGLDWGPDRRFWSHVLGGVTLTLLVLIQVEHYLIDPVEWTKRKYAARAIFHIEAKRVGLRLDELLAPDETFFQWGDEIGLYFYSGRTPPTGIMWSYHMLHGPLVRSHSERVLGDLANQPPELIIARRDLLQHTDHPVVQWFLERYEPFAWGDRGEQGSPFQFYYRKGGALESRRKLAVKPGPPSAPANVFLSNPPQAPGRS
jgi:hypothetical protein